VGRTSLEEGRRTSGARNGMTLRLNGRWAASVLAGFLTVTAACAPRPPAQAPEPREYAAHPDLRNVDATALHGRRILIDPGHGGRFTGTEGAGGTPEADVNLGVALYLWGLLRDAGADVHLTRASDRALGNAATVRDDLAARVHAIDSLAPEVFLSLHHNSNAALDRERNAVETYYKLDDDGASFDLGRAIHARLSEHLGIETARLRPGNYYVLREATTPAVLGEASYLSNPRIESRLKLAAKQQLEAEAYFLGLVDFFTRGSASVRKLAPAGDTLEIGVPLRFAIGEPIDPLSARLEVDGEPIPVHVDGVRGEITSLRELAAGAHEVRAQARLARGNAARQWTGALFVGTVAARAVLRQEPAIAAPGSIVRLRVALHDAYGRSVGDGFGVRITATEAALLDAETVTRAGEVWAVVRPAAGARLRLEADSLLADLPLRVEPGAARVGGVRCVDARTGAPIEGAWFEPGSASSDRMGWLAVPGGADSLAIERAGSLPWRGAAPEDGIVRLEPLFAGRLQGLRITLDAAGAPDETTLPGVGLSAGLAAHQVGAFVNDFLQAGGAAGTLLVERDDPISDFERLRRIGRLRPDLYVRLEVRAGRGAAAIHYPGSEGGERHARALASWVGRRLATNVALGADTRFLLQQTPCPAVVLELPAEAVRTPEAVRATAYAVFVGLRNGVDAEAAALPPLVGEVAPSGAAVRLVSLDAAEVLPVGADGRFQFECVSPGLHILRLHGAPPTVLEVRVSGSDTTRVRVAPSPR